MNNPLSAIKGNQPLNINNSRLSAFWNFSNLQQYISIMRNTTQCKFSNMPTETDMIKFTIHQTNTGVIS